MLNPLNRGYGWVRESYIRAVIASVLLMGTFLLARRLGSSAASRQERVILNSSPSRPVSTPDRGGARQPSGRLLFVFLVCLFIATSAGSTSSTDEEHIFYVAQGLAERFDPAL